MLGYVLAVICPFENIIRIPDTVPVSENKKVLPDLLTVTDPTSFN